MSLPVKSTLVQKRRPVNGTLVMKGVMGEAGGGAIKLRDKQGMVRGRLGGNR